MCLCARSVNAGAIEVFVTDNAGEPLANAVVQLVGSSEAVNVSKQPLVMDQMDKSFVPKVLLAPIHSEINFPNSDNIRHHVYSFSKAKTFELKLYAGQPKDPIKFDQEGIVVLGCNIHDSMVGYIYVTDAQAYLTDVNGMVYIQSLPEEVNSIAVWHPDTKQGVDYRKVIQVPSSNTSQITVSLDIQSPEPRNTFEDVFGSL
ncbi:methylamine utilization protein [Bermanella marisrubri]|nr:methylamine utilization protein [Bermanella marisrubri]